MKLGAYLMLLSRALGCNCYIFPITTLQQRLLGGISISLQSTDSLRVALNPKNPSEESDIPSYLSQDFSEPIGEISGHDLEDNLLENDFRARLLELQRGIGKRYKVRTQKGFLNVHSDALSPFSIENIVGKLSEGDIVTSIGPDRGDWVHHDGCGGGWSISKFGGWQWLVHLKD